MRSEHLSVLFVVLLSALWGLGAVGCAGDPEPPVVNDQQNDDEADVGDPEDVGDVGADADVDPDDDADTDPPPLAEWCEGCAEDGDCESGHCIELLDGEQICGQSCDPDDENGCPDDSTCMLYDADEQLYQCVPDAGTCDDPCEEITCPADEHCNPITGQCETHPRICDTGCFFDVECGDPDEHRCIGTGAPDGETMCTTTCDPNASAQDQEDLECPSDFVCAPLEEGADEGVCFPLQLTCVDRCQNVDCAGDENCDPVTGQCIQATHGACEGGCELDAHCEGQDDRCLTLGIGDGPHCWQTCTEQEGCPEGYECSPLLGLTDSLCLPETQQCTACEDADCFPDGVCDPTTGECMPHPEDCLVEGCDGDEICDPTTSRCVAPDRTCSGDTWAVDCDNVVTRCTSQTTGTEGVCARMCFDDDDCLGERSCESTDYGDLCLQPDFGGPDACGVTSEEGVELGQPCESGDCGFGHECIETGGVPGFCSHSCDDDADCSGDARCGFGPDGDSICLPAQCQCAADPLLDGELPEGFDEVLEELEMSACDLFITAQTIDELGDWHDRKLVDDELAALVAGPLPALGELRDSVGALDDAPDVAGIVAEAASLLQVDVASPQSYSMDDASLADAVADLDAAAGGDLDAGDIAADVDELPEEVEQLAAQLVAAAAEAYHARQDAFDDAGLDDDVLDELFDEAQRLVIAHDDDQSVPDLDDSDIEEALEDFPLEQLAQIGANTAASVDEAVADAQIDPVDFEDDEFALHVDTAAGAVIVGDAADNVYDPDLDPDLDGPTAVVLEIGGDNEYRNPVAANQSVQNAVSLLVDLDGADTYSYPKVGDDEDGEYLLESDDAGRIDGDDAGDDGPFSLSETARQGVGRLGIGMLFDYGEGEDDYETLRLGQGAGILGVGALVDAGGDNASFEAEAFAQGAAFHGVGLLHSAGGDNTYRLWHAGQGFGTGGGVGVLYDQSGHDEYTAVDGTGDDPVLYYSPGDAGTANQSLAQGAGTGGDDVGGGLGILRDAGGDDTYSASSYAQGYGDELGVGLLADADGDDDYQGRNYVQGSGVDAGAGILLDFGGDDGFNQDSSPQSFGQGSGQHLGWGILLVEGGENDVDTGTPGGGVGWEGGLGFALFDGGPNDHDNLGGGLGLASGEEDDDAPTAGLLTVGAFLQTGDEEDIYSHPLDADLDIGNDETWRQDDDDADNAYGVGIDR